MAHRFAQSVSLLPELSQINGLDDRPFQHRRFFHLQEGRLAQEYRFPGLSRQPVVGREAAGAIFLKFSFGAERRAGICNYGSATKTPLRHRTGAHQSQNLAVLTFDNWIRSQD